MHQAQVTAWGNLPTYTAAPDLPPPATNQYRIRVEAAGLHRVVKSRASGKHYTSTTLPHVPGVDGIGTIESRDETNGQTAYFVTLAPGAGGSMSEYVNVDKKSVTRLPKGADIYQTAALVNPALSSWMAMKTRTTNLPEGFSVLILGATSASGSIAIPLAKALGAKRIVGAARNKDALDKLGLDDAIVVAKKPEDTDFSNVGHVDVILDYIYGPLTAHLFKSLQTPKPTQYVHIGSLGGELDISVPGDILRSKNLTISGSGPGAWGMQRAVQLMPGLLEAIVNVPRQPVKKVNLKDVEQHWNSESKERVVFVP